MMMVHNVLTAHLVIQASIQGCLDLPVRMTAFVSSSGLKVSKPEVSGSAIHQEKHKQKVVVRG
jgi:hypothetical protein